MHKLSFFITFKYLGIHSYNTQNVDDNRNSRIEKQEVFIYV